MTRTMKQVGRGRSEKAARAVKRLTWFQQNDLRAEQLLKDVLQRKGPQRFVDVRPDHQRIIEGYLALFGPKELSKIRTGSLMRADRPPLRLPTSGVTTSFKGEILGDAIHATGDTYKIALYVAASTIGPGTTAYTATNEASGTGYTATGMVLAGRQIVLDGTTQILDWTTDPVWASATITARGALIYNDTKADRSIVVLDFGGDITSTNGNFTVTLPAPTAAAGLVRLA